MRSTDPIIPQIAIGLHVEPATAALLTTAFTLPYALVQPVLGALADTFNKARLMLLCLFILSAATLVCALAPSFEVLLAARVVAGLASGGIVPISFALVGDNFPVKERQVAMGRVLFAIMTGNLLGATCAGVIGDWLGWQGVFFVIGGFRRRCVDGRHSRLARIGRAHRPLRFFDAARELPDHLPQPAGEGLLRRGDHGSRVHVRHVSLCRHDAARGRRSPCGDCRRSARRFRHRRRALQRFRFAHPRFSRRAAHDAHRWRHDGLLPVSDRGARVVAVAVRDLRAARLRLLHAARRHPDLRQRIGAGRARLGHGAAFVLLLPGTSGGARGLRRRSQQRHRSRSGSGIRQRGARRHRASLRALAAAAGARSG